MKEDLITAIHAVAMLLVVYTVSVLMGFVQLINGG